VTVLKEIKAYNDGEFNCNGGAFFWLASTDIGGRWSDPVWEEIKTTSGCSSSATSVDEEEDAADSSDSSLLEDDGFEIVPMKFKVKGLLPGGDADDIKAEMTVILNRILLRLEEQVAGMNVRSVEENDSSNLNPIRGDEATIYYNVKVVSMSSGNDDDDEDRDWKSAIIEELRESYFDILYSIPFSDVRYISRDLEFNWCVNTKSGGYTLCVQEEPLPSIIKPSPAPVPSPASSTIIQSNSQKAGDNNSLPGWAIFLIVLLCLCPIGCCVGYWIFVRRKRNNSTTERNVNFYADDESQYNESQYNESQYTNDNNSHYTSDMSQYTNNSNQPWRKQALDALHQHDSYFKSSQSISPWTKTSQSIDSASYGSRTKRDALTQQLAEDPDSNTYSSRRYYADDGLPSFQPKRDPSVYSTTSRQEERPDPDSNSNASNSSSRRYYDVEDLPSSSTVKPKRDPSVYSITGSVTSTLRKAKKKGGRRKPDPDAASVRSSRSHHADTTTDERDTHPDVMFS